MASFFPPPGPSLPSFNTLLVSGPYHPSAPIHLALTQSLDASNSSAKTLFLSPSRSAFKDDLARFNDAWLSAHYGDGRVALLTSKMTIFYPPTPAHLCLLLSMLYVPGPDDDGNFQAWSSSKTMQLSTPSLIVLAEPSKYFSSNGLQLASSAITLSSYLNLINRVFASISNMTRGDKPPKLAVFDSQLCNLKLPVTFQPTVMTEDAVAAHQARGTLVLPLVENLFQWLAIFEDDSENYVPSSQGDEVDIDEGSKKKLRVYPGAKEDEDELKLYEWTEIRKRMHPRESETTHFVWT